MDTVNVAMCVTKSCGMNLCTHWDDPGVWGDSTSRDHGDCGRESASLGAYEAVLVLSERFA